MSEVKVGLSTLKKMWKQEYTNEHISMEWRFTKCHICWEYKGSIKAMPNERMKHAIQQSYNLHINLIMEEIKEYSRAWQATIESLDVIMTLIIDGID